jgi:hypothetical protein
MCLAVASWGHAFVWYGKTSERQVEVAGLTPAGDTLAYVVGYLTWVPSETGASYGDLDPEYLTAHYRVYLNEPDLGAVRAAVQSHLIFLREPKAPHVDDVALLRDVADAFKHQKLDRPSATVDGAHAIITTGTGWGKLRWGEGKWGGAEQVIVERKNGDQRALSSVMQNVFDAWLTLLGQPLPPIGKF